MLYCFARIQILTLICNNKPFSRSLHGLRILAVKCLFVAFKRWLFPCRFFLFARSLPSATFKGILLCTASISIISLSSNGFAEATIESFRVMWPTTKPCVPPLNLPSVISATDLPKPAPIMVCRFQHFRHSSTLFGPMLWITTTSPCMHTT